MLIAPTSTRLDLAGLEGRRERGGGKGVRVCHLFVAVELFLKFLHSLNDKNQREFDVCPELFISAQFSDGKLRAEFSYYHTHKMLKNRYKTLSEL